MELFLENWYDKYLKELSKTKNLKIISPFVSEGIITKSQSIFDFRNLELITRYNMTDFKMNVSSLSALKFSVERGASIYGVKNLHSKIYLFDKRCAIITSANMTFGGMRRNFECGIYLNDKKIINELHSYFNDLKRKANNKLTTNNCDEWDNNLAKIKVPKINADKLPDLGATLKPDINEVNYYIKFFGTGNKGRQELDYSVRDTISSSLCHYACTYPINRRPKRINDGDIIFMARMTKHPNDYSIFGKAIAKKHRNGIDDATEKEKIERNWKNKWPHYIRVEKPVFFDGILKDGIFLHDLINRFDFNSFESTKRNHEKGLRNINPRESLTRKPDVKLTIQAAIWLEQKLDEVITKKGKVSDHFLKSLPQAEKRIP